MLKGMFELTTICSHLASPSFDTESLQRPDLQTHAHGINRIGRIAIIGIGNPLVEEDCAAIAMLQLLQKRRDPESDYCLFNFDSGFAWLKEVFQRHESVIILDSILDHTNSQDGFVTIPLTQDVIVNSGLTIRATHGLSWLDEIKLLDCGSTGSMFFFGIDGHKFKHGNEKQRAAFLVRAQTGLTELIERCSISPRTKPHGGGYFNA